MVGFTASAPWAHGQTFSVLHSFEGGTDGEGPYGGVVRDAAGNLYGTTSYGGAFSNGTVFKLDTTRKETVLYSCTGGSAGAIPLAGLILDAAGNLYGTTEAGGDLNCKSPVGCGTVFKVDKTGKETVLYSFTPEADGAGTPFAGVIRDAAGNLYGTTADGGPFYSGTVFKLDSTGKETVLYRFPGGSSVFLPFGGVIRDEEGNLYGTTQGGGYYFDGTVFKLNPVGYETVLYNFGSGTDGTLPVAGVIADTAGNLYGTTQYGGTSNLGTVFKLDKTGKETVLYSFTGGADGASPVAGLVRDAAGNLYGTAYFGGDSGSFCSGVGGCGVVFKIAP